MTIIKCILIGSYQTTITPTFCHTVLSVVGVGSTDGRTDGTDRRGNRVEVR